jgi:hypothetical protein
MTACTLLMVSATMVARDQYSLVARDQTAPGINIVLGDSIYVIGDQTAPIVAIE